MAAIQELAQRVKPEGDTSYVDTDAGIDDASADGSESKPYKSLAYAMIANIERPATKYLSRASKTGDDPGAALQWKEPAKSAVKKATSAVEQHKKKLAKQASTAAQDPSLPEARKLRIDDKNVELGEGDKKGRIKVSGRIHRLRPQKQATFIELVDGYGHLQCILAAGPLTSTYDALTFTQSTSLTLYGEMKKAPETAKVPDNRELHVDYYEVLGAAPTDLDALTNKVSATQDQWESDMLDNRHLVLRGDKASSVMKLRSEVDYAFRHLYKQMKIRQVSPPALVQTQVEGGSTLFGFNYYGENSYLTQSSQLYLETVLPSMGNVYCIEKSFRAEKSLTRRHLSEYTHIEAELDFITFEDLLSHLEEMICGVVDMVLADEELAGYIKQLNPGFQKPSRPFMRMKYTDAIDWLNAQDPPILNEEGKPHVFGDDIAEAAERKMTDTINKPILLTHFPVEIKAFYMKKDPNDLRVTESVDVLMPNVGEIVGGSMRMEGYDELVQAFNKHGISPDPYYWYLDQRKYGTSPHGGYGLGLERFLAWLANQHTVRTCCMYPRFMGRCKP
ncbi:hypothetical protein INS49_006691 [Diaporthe citri]|uniref:uncharacterized protein n=1 Tax=Diaporthe citri TaxID=83186 RepID=UPI001C81E5E0|nr:uncharacterized protein INS49_006691 [Diaporthe citri]KAG6365085.1 hypothetical protein INS49_006691 [Diaporthe citri]